MKARFLCWSHCKSLLAERGGSRVSPSERMVMVAPPDQWLDHSGGRDRGPPPHHSLFAKVLLGITNTPLTVSVTTAAPCILHLGNVGRKSLEVPSHRWFTQPAAECWGPKRFICALITCSCYIYLYMLIYEGGAVVRHGASKRKFWLPSKDMYSIWMCESGMLNLPSVWLVVQCVQGVTRLSGKLG